VHQLPHPGVSPRGQDHRGFSATSKGCSYCPFSGATLGTLATEIEGYSSTKSALHFDEPLPAVLVRKLLKARMAEGARARVSKEGRVGARTR